ncbi:DUF6461 domain-containing protein [Nonomuraea purpurea]|uniref:DUF6461 domain-containing protein n=1 Tax=Nonomuraea purpurea TaxID=1849276 RepID=A0ABV8FWP6_9ACTN
MSTDLENLYLRVVADLAASLPDVSLTWCRAAGVEDVAIALGGLPPSAVRRSLREASEEAGQHVQESGHGKTLVVGELAPWILVLEPDDWNGAEALPRLSSGGEAVSLWFGDTMRHYNLHYAKDGRELCRFAWGAEPDGAPSPLAGQLRGLSLSAEPPPMGAQEWRPPSFDEWKVHALILAERITGARLTAEWLSREHTRFVQGPHARDVPPDDGELWP